MKTRFTIKAFIPIILLPIMVVLLITILIELINNPFYKGKIFPQIFLPGMLIMVIAFLILIEIKHKFIIVEFNENQTKSKKFGGLKILMINNLDIKGWKNSHLTSKGGTYEYLYLYVNEKRIVKISEFYHSNYFIVKNHIESNFNYLGYEEYSMSKEFKEMLQS